MIDETTARRKMKAKQRNENWEERKERSKLSREEIEQLQLKRADLRRRIEDKDADPDRANMVEEDPELQFQTFSQLPISQRTLIGIERGNYKRMTPIQCDSLYLSLAGFDVLGAAKTGSGKTLCFVIPVLEQLFLQHWSADMGVGAIILTPTRELALQIFKVMQQVGYKHVLSAALLTGGRDMKEEQKRLHAISIMIGTPGRILHHLQDTSDLVLDNLQILCMDEADRLLDMGFRDALLDILKYLPTDRQTLLFSATQTTDIQMLAQMSLKNPRYVTSHAMTKAPTPSTLCQNFTVVELHRKLDVLLAFLKKHPSDKIVVFASTCNQVKYMYLAFSKIMKKMRIPSMCLTSKMKQFRREEVFMTFCRCKSAVLFCTDVAARGLDFPLVHWVIQYDCPDSAQTYIHRVGRTARAGARGAGVLFLTPREVPFLSYLANKNVPMREIAIRPSQLQVSREIFVALVVQGLKYEAQKAFIAYVRSVYFASNKHVFDIKSIDMEAFARSLGLPATPDMSDMDFRRSAKNLPWDVVNYLTGKGEDPAKANLTRKEKHLQASDMFRQLQQQQKYAPKAAFGENNSEEDRDDAENDDDDGFLVKKVKSTNTQGSSSSKNADDETDDLAKGLSAEERMAGLSKHKIRKYIETADLRVRDLGLSKRIVYDESDSDDEEETRGTEEQPSDVTLGTLKAIVKSNANKKKENNEEGENEVDEDGDDDEGGEDPEAYAQKLRKHLQDSKMSDADRAKQLRRLRKLQRMGKLSKKITLEESGVSAAKSGIRPPKTGSRYDDSDNDSDGDYYRGDDDSDSSDENEENSDSDNSIAELVQLAKKVKQEQQQKKKGGSGAEPFSPEEDSDEDDESFHGIDSDFSDEGGDEASDASDDEEVAPAPPKKKSKRG